MNYIEAGLDVDLNAEQIDLRVIQMDSVVEWKSEGFLFGLDFEASLEIG
jgi:hypothetical protein